MENVTDRVYTVLTERFADHTPDEIAAQTELDAAAVADALAELVADGKAVSVGAGAFVSAAAWKRITDTAVKAVTLFHKRNPYKAAMPYGELRAVLQKAATTRNGDALFTCLAEHGLLVRTKQGVTLPGFALVLPPKWQEAADAILPVFVAGGLTDPPWHGNFRPHLPRDVPLDAVLAALCETGDLIKLTDDLYVAASAVAPFVQTLRDLQTANVPLSVGAVRDATGSSRRVMVPLLEYLDKQGVTARQDDARVLLKPVGE